MNIPGWVQNIWRRIKTAMPVTLMILGVAVSISVMGMLIEVYEVLFGDDEREIAHNLLSYLELSAIFIFLVGPAILTVFVALSWLTDFLTERLSGMKLPEKSPENLPEQSEKRASVKFDDQSIITTSPEGEVLQLAWADIDSLLIETTDLGPEVCDVFWIIRPHDKIKDMLVIPLDAEGADDLLPALQNRLPGFNNQEVLAAMGTTTPAVFEIWSAGKSPDEENQFATAV